MSTIAAISTPAGTGGIAVIRISGAEALTIADRMCECFSAGKTLTQVGGGRTARVRIKDEEDGALDDGIVTVFRAPASYTGEDVVEISCHGGAYITRMVLRSAIAHGAVPAGPGEFTKRAFLNGKLSLTQAEAVMGLISAGGKSSAKAALSLLEGSLSRELRRIRDELTDTASHISAWIDFPEEDVEEVSHDVLEAALKKAEASIRVLVEGYDRGKLVSEGINAVICGRPNVGKSTLMNLLAGYEKSIVADIAGTTRDIVEENILLDGYTIRLSDTAGLRDTGDFVESIGVDKARKCMAQADLILAVFEGSEQPGKEDLDLIEELKDKRYIAIINKSDLGQKLPSSLFEAAQDVVLISAKTGEGFEELRSAILTALELNEFDAAAPLLAGERQFYCAKNAWQSVKEAEDALHIGMTLDAVWVCVQSAVAALCELDGTSADESMIEGVFKNFCVGK